MYAVGFCMYKYENDMLPQLCIPIYGTVRGQKSFEYVGVRTWNYILQNIKARCPIRRFKSSLRKLCMVCPINDFEFLYWT